MKINRLHITGIFLNIEWPIYYNVHHLEGSDPSADVKFINTILIKGSKAQTIAPEDLEEGWLSEKLLHQMKNQITGKASC